MTGKPEPVAETDPCRGETDLLAALHASMGGRPTDLPPVPAIFCSAVDPFTGDWCRLLASDCRADDGIGQHSPDGVDPWTPPTNTKD